MAGLAMIIGAYVMGLSLSRTDIAHVIQEHLHGMYDVLVPVFFCVMGMMVDFSAMQGVAGLRPGLCRRGHRGQARRVRAAGAADELQPARAPPASAIGMVPRGEVALIVAGIGLSPKSSSRGLRRGDPDDHAHDAHGPAAAQRVVRGRIGPQGRTQPRRQDGRSTHRPRVSLAEILAEFVLSRLVRGFRDEEFFVYRLGRESRPTRSARTTWCSPCPRMANRVLLTTPARHEHVARFIVLEEILELQDMAQAFEKLQELDTVKASLLQGLF